MTTPEDNRGMPADNKGQHGQTDQQNQERQALKQDDKQGQQNEVPAEYAHIKGWGIDADPKNQPTYPMKKRIPEEHDGYSWERPTQQAIDREVLYSIERPGVSAVFGDAPAPSGLSGAIRRWAFQFSEDNYNHWVPLLLADRIQMIEGVLDDLAHGHVPNIVEEKGLRADWEFDRERLLGKIAVGAGIAALGYWLWQRRDNQQMESLHYDASDYDEDYPLDADEYYQDYDSDAYYGTNRPY